MLYSFTIFLFTISYGMVQNNIPKLMI